MYFSSYKRIVLKIGSSLLVEADNQLRQEWLNTLAENIASLRKTSELLIVSSGSVALGKPILSQALHQPNLKQAAAACGQPLLMQAWQNVLEYQQLKSAQILLTLNDTENRQAYLNARNTISTLLNRGIIPIINENDSVTTHGILYGDNDRLAARIATMCDADCLILLSDVDGLYDANPIENPQAKHLATVTEITADIEAMAGDTASAVGSGGMCTKIEAAKIATRGGCTTFIGDGRPKHPLSSWQKGTEFIAVKNTPSAKRRWISGSIEPAGRITIDAGAEKALIGGGSLLHVGIHAIEGQFSQGDTLEIVSLKGHALGKGLSSLDSEIAQKLRGKRSEQIPEILGYEVAAELIHRDHMVLN